jgi:hypothetical protein
MPDVLRLDVSRGIVFLGDAKHTEYPECKDTQVRLSRYLSWLASFLNGKRGIGFFGICFGNAAHAHGWVEVIQRLCEEAGLSCIRQGLDYFGSGRIVAWLIIK